MSIQVKLFAGLRELAEGQERIVLNLLPPVTVAEVRRAIVEALPAAESIIGRAMVAVNHGYAPEDTLIGPEDEVALIPPVGGGSPRAFPSTMLTQEPLSVENAYRYLLDSRFGGIVLFCGTVREWTEGRRTTHLEYEAYAEMALRQMQRIEADVKHHWPDIVTLQWHRVGHLKPAEIAVICGAAAPHRSDAFAAARQLIERLKAEVPIWKKEFYADGEAVWRENAEASESEPR